MKIETKLLVTKNSSQACREEGSAGGCEAIEASIAVMHDNICIDG